MAASGLREAKPRLASRATSTADLFRLDHRTILITGGGGSMGLEIAGSVLESGGDVICVDRADSPLQEPWGEVQVKATRQETKVWYYQCDVTNVDQVHRVFEEAISQARYPFCGMVACAGISGGGPTIDFSAQEARRIIDINIMGTFICCQAAGKQFQKQNQRASVVLIASMSGHISNEGVDTAAYNASKSAILQLSRSLAAEWGSRVDMPSVRVNTISPGYIRTRMTAVDLEDKEVERKWCAGNMLMRLSDADEYRGPAMFLLSDASSFVTGSDLRVDGGHTAW